MQQFPPGPMVATPSGWVRGRCRQQINRFLGVPYARVVQRFQAPAPQPPWMGLLDATDFGPICPQLGELTERRASDANVLGRIRYLPMVEDCLRLNIWAPAGAVRQPVMVWLHGRGFAAGAGSETWYDGHNLARRGELLVVTLNHRLGPFGFLHLAALGGADYVDAGNVGMLDIIAALQWLRVHISAFGGDPDNITLFGESAGGTKVSTLLAMPAAQGLFHKAIIQSGAGPGAVTVADAEALTKALVTHLELGAQPLPALTQMPPAALLAALRNLPLSQQRSRISGRRSPLLRLGPVADDVHLASDPMLPTAAVPLLLGSNLDEAAMFLATDRRRGRLTLAELRMRLAAWSATATQLLPLFQQRLPDASPWALLVAIQSSFTQRAAWQLANWRLAADPAAPVYMYQLHWRTDFRGGIFGACHALDVPLVFDNCALVPLTGSRPGKWQLAADMSSAWCHFARYGRPGHAGLPTWPAYEPGQRSTLIFDEPCRLQSWPDPALQQLWQQG